MYGGDPQHQQRPPPVPPYPPPPQLQNHHQFHHHQQPHDFPRGPHPPGPPPHLMRQPSASSTNMNPPPHDYHHNQQHPHGQPPFHGQAPYEAHSDAYGAKRIRKIGQRRAVDYTSTVVRYMQIRMFQRDSRDRTVIQPHPVAAIDMLPPVAYSDNPSIGFAAKFVHTSLNKNRCPINRVLWTPSGRRLITGSQSGEFTLWNGQSFNFEMILQAHEQAVRSMIWSYNENWMVTGDDGGSIKYWLPNMNNVKANKLAHKESVRGLSFCRTDLKFCSCSDDTTVKVWDFARCQEERTLSDAVPRCPFSLLPKENAKLIMSDVVSSSIRFGQDLRNWLKMLDSAGHGGDVKCVDWHPTKSLLVSGACFVCSYAEETVFELPVAYSFEMPLGGKDNIVKLWDSKSGRELCSFHGHKNTVLCAKWNQNGNWVLTSSKNQIIKLYDIRAMKELESFRGHKKDVTALAWHPFHEEYFVSGSYDGSIFHWLVGHETPQVEIQNAHDNSVWDLAWHPMGYLLCSGGHDNATKFWCRNRPGDPARDKFSAGTTQGFGEQGPAMGARANAPFFMPDAPSTPGPFGPGLARNEGTIPGIGAAMPLSIPSLGSAPPLPPGPHPSLLMGNKQQPYQQNAPLGPPHQMSSPPLPPPNMSQQQAPHLPLLSHSHFPRPQPQLQQLNMNTNVPGSLPSHSMPNAIPGPMSGQMGGMNQMGPPMPQSHFMGMNPMPSGSGPPGNIPLGAIPTGLPNMQGQSNPSGNQMYQPGGGFNRPQTGQMPMMPGINPYQSGNPNAPGMPSGFNLQSGVPPPLPPGPPPHDQAHQ